MGHHIVPPFKSEANLLTTHLFYFQAYDLLHKSEKIWRPQLR